MAKRHSDAIFIQLGACNPSGIAISIVDACREIRAEPGYSGTDQLCSDPALRLMIHQLAYITKIRALDDGVLDYSQALDECKRLSEVKAEVSNVQA